MWPFTRQGRHSPASLPAGKDGPVSSGGLELLKWGLGLRKRYRISGTSMLPALKAGQHVLVNPRIKPLSLEAGAVVVLKHPLRRDFKLVKRIQKIQDRKTLFIRGDNPDSSTDSGDFGPVPAASVLGLVTSVLA